VFENAHRQSYAHLVDIKAAQDLANIRETVPVSFEQLADRLASTADELRRIEAGPIRPTPQLLIAIAQALEVRLTEVIDQATGHLQIRH
jgi:ribosome-binding protein aMBF1 (putative translation factor)